jgi:hypothetical protein
VETFFDWICHNQMVYIYRCKYFIVLLSFSRLVIFDEETALHWSTFFHLDKNRQSTTHIIQRWTSNSKKKKKIDDFRKTFVWLLLNFFLHQVFYSDPSRTHIWPNKSSTTSIFERMSPSYLSHCFYYLIIISFEYYKANEKYGRWLLLFFLFIIRNSLTMSLHLSAYH